MSDVIIAIDLGTTFSRVAYVDEGGIVRIIENDRGEAATPSVVKIKDGKTEVGDFAINSWRTDSEHVVRSIKTAIGRKDYRFQEMTPVEISTEILKVLKANAERNLGQNIEQAVITYPAYFTAVEIENTKKAGEQAGFKVKEIIKEPVAAAIRYGIENLSDGERILVCDLGGGTYDATILSFKKGVFTPLATTTYPA